METLCSSALHLNQGNYSPRKELGHTFPGIQQSWRKPDCQHHQNPSYWLPLGLLGVSLHRFAKAMDLHVTLGNHLPRS